MDKEGLLKEWRSTLTEKEEALHHMAQIKLKKVLKVDGADDDQGSYFPEKSHAFRAWLKSKETTTTKK
jgi:hypothetical protein